MKLTSINTEAKIEREDKIFEDIITGGNQGIEEAFKHFDEK